MIIYTRNILKAYELNKKVPSFIKCKNIISNQAFYSLAFLKKESNVSKDVIDNLMAKANLTGIINEINDLDDLFINVDMNKVLEILVGKKKTNKSIKRGDKFAMQDIILLTGNMYKTDTMAVASIISLKTLQQLKDFSSYLIYCTNPEVLQGYLDLIKKVSA